MVFDRLIGADDATELEPLLGVRRSHVGGLAGGPHRVGGQDHAGQIDQRLAGAGQDGDGRVVEADLGAAPRRIHVGRHCDLDALADLDDGDVVSGRDEDHLGQPAPENDAGVA